MKAAKPTRRSPGADRRIDRFGNLHRLHRSGRILSLRIAGVVPCPYNGRIRKLRVIVKALVWNVRLTQPLTVFAFLAVQSFLVSAQTGKTVKLKLDTGKEIYQAGCAGCHGPDGKGQPETTVGFEKPDTFPDFTECDQTTPEDNRAWKSVIRDGGPFRGFSQIMPSFSEALTSAQIESRGSIHARLLPRARLAARRELNLPRPFATRRKHFRKENIVITTAINVRGAPGVSNKSFIGNDWI